jgi:diaminopimelate decarboxylase
MKSNVGRSLPAKDGAQCAPYGFSMSSNYNARPRVAEILVQDDQFYVIRKRETYRQLVWGENIPEFLK